MSNDKMNALIDAAEERAKLYDEDDRDCIKADVMNAFFAGVAYAQAAANKAVEEGELPELPEKSVIDRHIPTGIVFRGHTDKAMKEYGRQAIAADRAARPVANKAEVEPAGSSVAIWDAITRLERTDSTQEERFAAADALRKIATPPATTGASTVLTNDRISALWLQSERHYDFARAIEREVAAQAGQVASVPSAAAVPDRERRIPDSECAQSSCAQVSYGCKGKCCLSNVDLSKLVVSPAKESK